MLISSTRPKELAHYPQGDRMDPITYWRLVTSAFIRTRVAANNERGASLVEYALLVGLIALVCIVSISFFGTSMSSKYNVVGSSVIGS